MKKFKMLGITLSFLLLGLMCVYATPQKDNKASPGIHSCQLVVDHNFESPAVHVISYLPQSDAEYSPGWRIEIYHEYVNPAKSFICDRPGNYRFLDGAYMSLPQKNC